jgi:hypothetical protein
MTNLKSMTARVIRETMPDPASIEIVPIPGKLRRELFRAMQQHDKLAFAEYCHAHDMTAGTLTRDLYFQIAHQIDFPIHEWLERECEILDRDKRAKRQTQTGPARAAKGKLAVAVALLESLGYAWHGASEKFVKLPEQW